MTLKKPNFTSFQISEFQRERDVIAYCYGILYELGGDDGPTMTTLEDILFRIKEKVLEKEKL